MRNIKIGIITFHFSDNFGALLQAYGLKAYLAAQGCNVEFINYHPAHVEDGGDFKNLLDPQAAKANLKTAYLKLARLQRAILGNRNQANEFEAFRQTGLGLSGPRLQNKAELEKHLAEMPVPYDIIVLGSDQIWSASQQAGIDPVYFGDFRTPSQVRRISYAPSFGRVTIDEACRSELSRMIGAVDSVSCRERSGATIVRELIGREVPCVPDPTILLGDFSRLTSNSTGPQNHVFCYALRSGRGIREVANWVSEEVGSEVLSPYNIHRRWKEIGRTIYPNPAEWVAGIERSSFVVTNSFHGAVFSILLRRPFLVVGLPGERASLNERSLNLLSEVGLLDRFVENGELAAVQRSFSRPIDWNAVHAKLSIMQAAGRHYLLSELGHFTINRNARIDQ